MKGGFEEGKDTSKKWTPFAGVSIFGINCSPGRTSAKGGQAPAYAGQRLPAGEEQGV
jgi:hypothetical protein